MRSRRARSALSCFLVITHRRVKFGNETHNEPTVLVVDVLLQQGLWQRSVKVGVRSHRTNLILDHGVANVVNQATELIRILGVVEETLELALDSKWLEFSGDFFQFANDPCSSESVHDTGKHRHTVPDYFSWIFPSYHPREPVRRAIRQGL